MNWLNNITPEDVLALLIFIIGLAGIVYINKKYADIFRSAADKDPKTAAEQTGITFVSGHFLAFFLLPFALIAAVSLAIIGKLDSGVAAIIGMIVGYVLNKVIVR